MPYFAEIGANFEVLRVIVANDISWPQNRLGGVWAETLMTHPTQVYAGIGMNDARDISPKRFLSDWRQPVGSEDAYPKEAWVWHNGKAWLSLQAANVFEPGVASWREKLTEWPLWVQPTGAQDAYMIGEKITFEGAHYISVINDNVWSPTGYPPGWQIQ